MLSLTLYEKEPVSIGEEIVLFAKQHKGEQIKMWIGAPKQFAILRGRAVPAHLLSKPLKHGRWTEYGHWRGHIENVRGLMKQPELQEFLPELNAIMQRCISMANSHAEPTL